MANKKINQLVLKTTIQSTDLFPLGDATTGQLFKKTIAELQAAIGGAVISVNGLVGTVVLDTDDIQELATPTNKYFTDARARGAISLTVSGNSGASTYSNSTGVLNVPTYTLAGLGGITATFLSGASGIAYNSSTGVITYTGTVYTDASIRALFSAGTGISYNSSTGAITNSAPDQVVSISGGTGITVTGTYPSFTVAYSGTVYTDSSVRGLLSGTAPITYNSSTGAISITQASGSTNGFLSSTDWTTFNSKQSALTLGNVTEVASNVLMFPDGGTNKTIGNLSIQVVQSGASTNGYLSSTDWNTFNNKQGTITLTTTGTSGAATFSSGTLNIPNYSTALTGYVTLDTTQTISGAKTFSSALNGTSAIFSSTITGSSVFTPEKVASIIGIKAATSSGNGGSLTVKAGNGSGSGNTSGSLNLAFGRGGAGALSGSMNFGVAQATDDVGLDATYMTITSAGNVGIGTSSPSSLLHVVATSGQATIISEGSATSGEAAIQLRGKNSSGTSRIATFKYDNSDIIRIGTSAAIPMRFETSDVERMRITSGGNVGIGTASPTVFGGGMEIQRSSQAALRVSTTTGTLSGGAEFGYEGSDGGYIQTVQANGRFTFYMGNASVLTMRLTSGGNILMGTTTDNGERLYVSGSIRATGSITANSDARLKKNIERIENALEKVGQISGYTYNTIYDEERHAGVIAQEIDKVLPEIVNKGNDGLMGVEYGNISALLIEAIKDLKKDNESLRAIVEGLSK